MTVVTVLPIYCGYCHGAVTLHVSNWPGPHDVPAPEATQWNCPYCRKENTSGIPGYLEMVTKGHEDEDGVKRVH